MPLKANNNADPADESRRSNALLFPVTVAAHVRQGTNISNSHNGQVRAERVNAALSLGKKKGGK
jgi:hypothetical protein